MTYSFTRHLKKFKTSCAVMPFFILFLQIPEGLLTLLQKYLDSELSKSPVTSFLIIYPVYCISSVLTGVLTYLAIRDFPEGSPKFKSIWAVLLPRLGMLFMGALVVGILMIPAMMMFVLPGILVMALYLFVPFLILEEKGAKLSAYLFRSTKLSKKHLLICLLYSALAFILSLVSYFGGEIFGRFIVEKSSLSPLGTEIITTCIEILLAMLVGVFIDVWQATLFLEVKES